MTFISRNLRDSEVSPKAAFGEEIRAKDQVLGGEVPSEAPMRKFVFNLLNPS